MTPAALRGPIPAGITDRATRQGLRSIRSRVPRVLARYYWLLLAEGHLNRRLFGDMLRRIWALPVPAG